MNDEIKDRSGKIKAGGAVDELALQNVLRKRHKQDFPNTILQLTKRIQAVNQTWASVISKLMCIDDFRLSGYRSNETGGLVVDIWIGGEVERHEFTTEELQEAHQYVEVLLMDKVDHSGLIAKHTK